MIGYWRKHDVCLSVCMSVRLSVTLSSVHCVSQSKAKSCTSVFLIDMFLFVHLNTFAVRCSLSFSHKTRFRSSGNEIGNAVYGYMASGSNTSVMHIAQHICSGTVPFTRQLLPGQVSDNASCYYRVK